MKPVAGGRIARFLKISDPQCRGSSRDDALIRRFPGQSACSASGFVMHEPRSRVETGRPTRRTRRQSASAGRDHVGLRSKADRVEETIRGATATARASCRLVQHRRLLPAHELEAQQMRFAGGDAPSAPSTACGVDIGHVCQVVGLPFSAAARWRAVVVELGPGLGHWRLKSRWAHARLRNNWIMTNERTSSSSWFFIS